MSGHLLDGPAKDMVGSLKLLVMLTHGIGSRLRSVISCTAAVKTRPLQLGFD
jgi:hypothetical protein